MKLTYKEITISGPKRHEKQIKEYMEYIKAHYGELLDKAQKKNGALYGLWDNGGL